MLWCKQQQQQQQQQLKDVQEPSPPKQTNKNSFFFSKQALAIFAEPNSTFDLVVTFIIKNGPWIACSERGLVCGLTRDGDGLGGDELKSPVFFPFHSSTDNFCRGKSVFFLFCFFCGENPLRQCCGTKPDPSFTKIDDPAPLAWLYRQWLSSLACWLVGQTRVRTA